MELRRKDRLCHPVNCERSCWTSDGCIPVDTKIFQIVFVELGNLDIHDYHLVIRRGIIQNRFLSQIHETWYGFQHGGDGIGMTAIYQTG